MRKKHVIYKVYSIEESDEGNEFRTIFETGRMPLAIEKMTKFFEDTGRMCAIAEEFTLTGEVKGDGHRFLVVKRHNSGKRKDVVEFSTDDISIALDVHEGIHAETGAGWTALCLDTLTNKEI